MVYQKVSLVEKKAIHFIVFPGWGAGGSQTITWELGRNAHYQGPLHTKSSREFTAQHSVL